MLHRIAMNPDAAVTRSQLKGSRNPSSRPHPLGRLDRIPDGACSLCGEEPNLHQALQHREINPERRGLLSDHRKEDVVWKSAITMKFVPELVHRSMQQFVESAQASRILNIVLSGHIRITRRNGERRCKTR